MYHNNRGHSPDGLGAIAIAPIIGAVGGLVKVSKDPQRFAENAANARAAQAGSSTALHDGVTVNRSALEELRGRWAGPWWWATKAAQDDARAKYDAVRAQTTPPPAPRQPPSIVTPIVEAILDTPVGQQIRDEAVRGAVTDAARDTAQTAKAAMPLLIGALLLGMVFSGKRGG